MAESARGDAVEISSLMGLDGRVIVVAGAGGGGIGTAVCGMLAKAGASVVGLDVRPEALEVLDEALSGAGRPHRSVVVDVRRADQVEEAVADAAELGPLHGLVHVAGGMRPDQWASLLRTDLSAFDEVLELNLRAGLVTTRAAAARLTEEGAGPLGVTVAAVSPLAVTLALGNAYLEDPELEARLQRLVPLGRIGDPETDIAPVIRFLCEDGSRYITGQTIVVDGGRFTSL